MFIWFDSGMISCVKLYCEISCDEIYIWCIFCDDLLCWIILWDILRWNNTYDVFSVSNYSVVHYNYYNTFTYSYFLLLSFFELNNLVYTVVASYLTYIQYFNYTNMYHIGYGLTIINQLIYGEIIYNNYERTMTWISS